jgi:hypothetical protein
MVGKKKPAPGIQRRHMALRPHGNGSHSQSRSPNSSRLQPLQKKKLLQPPRRTRRRHRSQSPATARMAAAAALRCCFPGSAIGSGFVRPSSSRRGRHVAAVAGEPEPAASLGHRSRVDFPILHQVNPSFYPRSIRCCPGYLFKLNQS